MTSHNNDPAYAYYDKYGEYNPDSEPGQEAIKALQQLIDGEVVAEFKRVKVQDPDASSTNGVDWTAYYYIQDRIAALDGEEQKAVCMEDVSDHD